MTAEVFNLRDYQSKKAIARAHAELEKHLSETNVAFPAIYTETAGYTMGNGIDGMTFADNKDPA